MTTNSIITTNLPIPPGEYLEEVIESLGMSKGELAKRMDRPPAKLSAIFSGEKAITPDTALQLERATGVPAHVWTGLENEYRLAQAKQRAEEREAACETETPLVTRFCYAELAKLGFVRKCTRAVEKVQELQEFFGVMSLEKVMGMPRYQVTHRHGRGTPEGRSPEAVAAWLRVGERTAMQTDCPPYDADFLAERLKEVRSLTTEKADVFSGKLRNILKDVGVVLVYCPHFPKTKAHGATFFLGDEKAVLMLTARYRWADIFWFTLFHELGHILLHNPKDVILEDSTKDARETEADEFACDTLIPPDEWETFIETEDFQSPHIKRFAKRVGIAPGIVVGRLQHEGWIGRGVGNGLREQYVIQ